MFYTQTKRVYGFEWSVNVRQFTELFISFVKSDHEMIYRSRVQLENEN